MRSPATCTEGRRATTLVVLLQIRAHVRRWQWAGVPPGSRVEHLPPAPGGNPTSYETADAAKDRPANRPQRADAVLERVRVPRAAHPARGAGRCTAQCTQSDDLPDRGRVRDSARHGGQPPGHHRHDGPKSSSRRHCRHPSFGLHRTHRHATVPISRRMERGGGSRPCRASGTFAATIHAGSPTSSSRRSRTPRRRGSRTSTVL